MRIVPIKIGGKAQATQKRISCILDQVGDFLRAGNKVVLMPSAQGDQTDHLLNQARDEGMTDGKALAHYLLHNGEEVSGDHMSYELKKRGFSSRLIRPEDPEFFLCGDFSRTPYDNRNMEFIKRNRGYVNCSVDCEQSAGCADDFLSMLDENDVVVFTAWAVKRNSSIGLIKGRGGSDGSLVAVSDVLKIRNQPVHYSIKITDVYHVHDMNGQRIRSMEPGRMIDMLEKQGSWPVQKYALERIRGTNVVLGVTHYRNIFEVGTYISEREI